MLCRAAWERQRNKPKGLTEAEVKDRPPKDPSLACPYPACGKLLRDAIKTPCCHTTYCEDCIHTHLLEKNWECPKCKNRIPSLDKLKIDSEARNKVREYVRNAVDESRKEVEAAESATTTQVRPTLSLFHLRSVSSVVNSPECIGFSSYSFLSDMFLYLVFSVPQSSEAKTPEAKPDEDYSEQQPGNDDNGTANPPPFLDPQSMVTQLQAQLAQLFIMQSNPTLPPPARMNITSQIHQLTMLLKQAEQARDMMAMNMMGGMGMNGMGGMGMHSNGMMGANGNMGTMGMGMQPGMGMMGGYGGPPQQQQWSKPMPIQPQLNTQSAYDRLPVNNRRPKRDRPEDFSEGGPDAKRQYWE